MDSLDRAVKHIKKKYKKTKRIYDCVEIGFDFELHETNEKDLKLLLFIHKLGRTIIYDLKIEDFVK
jgi:hypothetical protein